MQAQWLRKGTLAPVARDLGPARMNHRHTTVDLPLLRLALAWEGFDGRAAQRPMEPAARGIPARRIDASGPLRDAAALAYVFESDGALHLPLTLRHEGLREHRGQVSLPGGRPEAGESMLETALREAREEIALQTGELELLGVLHPVDIPVTHTRLHIHVAYGPQPVELRPNPGEVERIEVVALADLLDPLLRKRRQIDIQGREIDAPYFDVAGLFLWGATAMGLSELAERLRAAGTQPGPG